ncbi:MAG: hypothetical protein NVS4B11_21640 [Ktedonobacteraceae bacterium]
MRFCTNSTIFPLLSNWTGERDWHLLVEDLDSEEALLILRVLETLQQPSSEDIEEEDDEA